MKLVHYMFLTLFVLPGIVVAQTPDDRFELSGFLGGALNDRSRVNHELTGDLGLPGDPATATIRRSYDSGLLFTFKVGYHLSRNLQLEGSFGIGPSQKLNLFSEFDCSGNQNCVGPFSNQLDANSFYFDGNVVYNFHYGNFSPFITAGIGALNSKVHIEDVSDFALNFGAGAKYYFGRIGLRLEVNDHVIPNYRFTDSTEHDLQINSGILFRF